MVKLEASTASYREPYAQLYHETLPLPTPTTLVGIAGAALGLNMQDALSLFKEHRILVGTIGTHDGTAKDLWQYNKVKQGGKVDKDIIIREFLYHVSITVYYASEDETIIYRLKDAFHDPVYAITLGSSDDLARIKDINKMDQIKESRSKSVKYTWVYHIYRSNMTLDWDYINQVPLSETIQPPVIKNIPVNFTFDKDGARKAEEHINIAYMNPYTLLDEEIMVREFGNDLVPMYRYTS
ncbi:CRISPR-associated protein Cas5 [Vallitalea pronyensis]|uniref:CRISPR-associated protein Cas5 n=1 Tax=Vallitalea pronyensis TaxID=1348613 RepID=A0A8J8MM81_9FIRM|nr:CRISPR-associated protein Cas5 [Vallitalea pronyensis]QUI23977.1 CRISPR-associated protein Cas5 [Vallitalea pronyensis]